MPDHVDGRTSTLRVAVNQPGQPIDRGQRPAPVDVGLNRQQIFDHRAERPTAAAQTSKVTDCHIDSFNVARCQFVNVLPRPQQGSSTATKQVQVGSQGAHVS